MNTTNVSRMDGLDIYSRLAIGTINVVFFFVVTFALILVAKNKVMTLPSKILLGNLMLAHLGYWLNGIIRVGVIQYIQGMDCMILIYITVAQLYGSIFAVAAVAADRFVATRFPFKYMEIKGTYVVLFLVSVWAITPFFSVATFWGGVDESNACQPWFSMPLKGLILFGVTVAFSTTSVLMMCLYVGKAVIRHLRSINDTAFALTRDQKQKMRGFVKQLDTTLTFGLIALSHCLMVFPLIIIFPLMNTGRYDQSTMTGLMVIFGTCSRVSDPFIYILITKIKGSKCCRRRLPSVTTSSMSSKVGQSAETRMTRSLHSISADNDIARTTCPTPRRTLHVSDAIVNTVAALV